MSNRVLKKKKKKTVKKRFNPLPVILLIIIVYVAVALYYDKHFFPGTIIGDIACGGKTAEQVKELINRQSESYSLEITGKDGKNETLLASEIDLEFLLDDTISEVKKDQKNFLWPLFLWNKKDHQVGIEVAYDEEKLEQRLIGMSFFTSPYNEFLREVGQMIGLSANDETMGTVEEAQLAGQAPVDYTTPDIGRTKDAVRSAVSGLESALDLVAAGCYNDSDIAEGDTGPLTPYEEKLQGYRNARIVYDWHGNTEIIDHNLIDTWLIKDERAGTVELNEEAVREYVTSLSRKYDRFGSPRTFHTSKGEDIKVDVVCYGWRVKRDAEGDALIDDIRNGRVVEREPEYLYTAYNKGPDDIGDSYVEIDIKNQHLYLYIKGERVLESDFVSGNLSKNFDTPDGIYPITYKERDATLNGQGYSSSVKYWMPFNGNVGMHDASWRKEFGGNIFMRSGSHGCVNLPTAKAEEIFGYMEKGFPVIVYGAKEARASLPKTDPAPTTDPALIDGSPSVDPEILLQMQQMMALQQQQVQELQDSGVDTTQLQPPAGVDPGTAEPAPQPVEDAPAPPAE